MMFSAAKYFVVGGLGTVTHLSLLYLFVEFLFLSPLVASSTAFVCVVLQSYSLNRNWTFQSDKAHATTLPRYVIVSCFGFATNLAIMFVMINIFALWYMAAQIVTIVVIPAMNFLLNKYWTFSE
ncbi:MAG: putative flippase GtrA [Halioglobus sp.]|jgi:putative flippase GtrA